MLQRMLQQYFRLRWEWHLAPCNVYSRACIDDVLVYSHSWEEHMNHITKLVSALCAAGRQLSQYNVNGDNSI